MPWLRGSGRVLRARRVVARARWCLRLLKAGSVAAWLPMLPRFTSADCGKAYTRWPIIPIPRGVLRRVCLLSGRGAVWQRAAFGTLRSEVQILSPRPCHESRHRRHMSRDIGDSRWTSPDVTYVARTPAIGRGLVVGCASRPSSGSIGGLERTSPVSRATTVTSCSSTMARTRRRAWAAPISRWCRRPARRRVIAPPLVDDVVAQPEVTRGAATGGMRLGRRPVGLGRGAAPDRPVRSLLVVGEPEGIELGLQLGEGPCWRLLPEPALEGLVEALDLALGLRMARGPVLLADAEVGEQVLEAVVAAGEARGVDRTVVGERGGGPAMRLAGRAERGHHVVAGDPPEGRAPEQVAGVVVEPASRSRPRSRRRGASGSCRTATARWVRRPRSGATSCAGACAARARPGPRRGGCAGWSRSMGPGALPARGARRSSPGRRRGPAR